MQSDKKEKYQKQQILVVFFALFLLGNRDKTLKLK